MLAPLSMVKSMEKEISICQMVEPIWASGKMVSSMASGLKSRAMVAVEKVNGIKENEYLKLQRKLRYRIQRIKTF